MALFRTVFSILIGLGAVIAADLPAHAQESGAFAVPVVTIYPGDTIGDEMVEMRNFVQLRVIRGGYVNSPHAIVGKVARRTLLPGVAIPANAVENAKVVEKGMPTQLVFQDGGLTITALVSPLQAGEANEVIKVRNLDSGLVVMGIVQADGTLRAVGEAK